MAIVGDEEVFQSLLFLLGNLEHEDFFLLLNANMQL